MRVIEVTVTYNVTIEDDTTSDKQALSDAINAADIRGVVPYMTTARVHERYDTPKRQVRRGIGSY